MKITTSISNNIRALMIAVLAVCTVAVAPQSAVAAPSNDYFITAIAISGANGDVVGTTAGASKQDNEPNHGGNPGGVSVWYKYTSPTNGVLDLYTGGSSIDTVIGIYTGNINSGLVKIAEGDDYSNLNTGSMWSPATVGIRAGVTYYIAVDGKDKFDGTGPKQGNFVLQYDFTPTPPNNSFSTPAHLSDGGGISTWTTSNIGATKEPGEPNHLGNAGGRSVWFKFYNQYRDYPRMVTLTVTSADGAHNQSGVVSTLVAVYTGNAVNNLTPVLANENSYFTGQKLTFLARPGLDYYIAVDGHNGGSGADTGTFTLTYGVAGNVKNPDVDKDGRTDLTVFRPGSGTWYSLVSGTNSMHALNWGASGDKPIIQKFQDDNVLFTVFRPQTGTWYRTPDGAAASIFSFGANGDIPLIRNTRFASGIVVSNAAVFRPSTGTWWIRSGSSGYAIQYGLNGDIPISADFTNDGNDEIAVFRPSNGNWYIYDLVTGEHRTQAFGLTGDKPVAADYDADGSADIAVFRPSNGTWYIMPSRGGNVKVVQFGQAGDIPQPADYTNDGAADMTVFRDGVWWIISPGYPVKALQWGTAGDIPVSSPIS